MLEVRHRVTNVLVLVNLGICATYLFTPPTHTENRARLVAYIEHLGPVWILAFMASGIFLLVARLRRRWLVEAHTFALSVSVFYSGALWVSVVIGVPFAFSIAAWASLAVAAGHYAMSRWYASGGAS